MKKLIIVDDNPLERNGLRSMIDWQELGIDVIMDFRNGEQALRQMEQLQPDIVLTDIRMPLMNGIELAANLRKNHPHIKVVFMSSYEHFEYAKSAVSLGVEEYLLKPVQTEDLRETFEKLIQKMLLQEQAQNEKADMLKQIEQAAPLYREQFFRELLFFGSDENQLKERLLLLQIQPSFEAEYRVVYMKLEEGDRLESGESTALNSILVPYSIKIFTQAACTESLNIFPVELSSKSYAFVLMYAVSDSENENTILECFIRLQDHMAVKHRCYASIGISNGSPWLNGLADCFKQAAKAADTPYYTEPGHLVLYSQVQNANEIEDRIDFQTLYHSAREEVAGQKPDAGRFLQKLIGGKERLSLAYLEGLRISVANAVQLMFADAGRSFKEMERLDSDFAQPPQSLDTLRNGIGLIFDEARMLLYAQDKGHYDIIVQDIRKFIEDHYQKQLTLQQISEAIYLSPSHMNNIFKTKMGKTVFDYLIEVRMEAAKQKLVNPYSKIYLVAQEVGYTNKSHFCQVFKKYTGFTPSEFKHRAIFIQ